ncbi:MAG TPA: MBL fold metallo-hydrolase [Candidatus Tectomicrobia bacterium]|nr:MBL fold metallo-hydrolase [Candidatus Tectomicrobia bacterium]
MTKRLGLVGCGLLAGAVALGAQRSEPAATNDVQALHVQGNVWMLHSAVANAAVQVGEDGVLVVDTMTGPLAAALVAEIRRIAPGKPIRWIVNTHADPDHTGGNLTVAEAGESIIAGNFAGQAGAAQADYAQIIAHEEVLTRMLAQEPAPPVFAQPSETFFVPKFELYYNGEPIEILHVPNAHCDGDVLVFFRKSDVVVAGDLFVTTTFPMIRLEQGGSVTGVLAGLNRLLDITVPKEKQEGGTYVIPGHGRLADEADVVDYRDMVTIIRDRVADARARGLTLEQIRAARLLRDYEGRWGATEGPWTTAAFLEAVHRSLAGEARGGSKGE